MSATVPSRAYYVGLHRYCFQGNTPAEILGIVMVTPDGDAARPCFHLKYPDGQEDFTPLVNEDHSGQGGLGVLYEIITEEQMLAGDIPSIAA